MKITVKFNTHIYLHNFSLNFIFIQVVCKLFNHSKLCSEGKKNLK